MNEAQMPEVSLHLVERWCQVSTLKFARKHDVVALPAVVHCSGRYNLKGAPSESKRTTDPHRNLRLTTS